MTRVVTGVNRLPIRSVSNCFRREPWDRVPGRSDLVLSEATFVPVCFIIFRFDGGQEVLQTQCSWITAVRLGYN